MTAFSEPITTYSNLEPGGMRAVARHVAGPVEICGIAVAAGSRDEDAGEYGLAHLVEHTIFKGTSRRRARHINNRMEAVGGELNAYTTKEETFLYSLFPAGNLARAVELIADLVIGSNFPENEVEKERRVVCDEIDSYLDNPSEGIFDDFEELAYAGSPLAHNILGTETSVEALTGTDCRKFLERHYTPGRMVFFYQGPARASVVMKIATRYFGRLTRRDESLRRDAPAGIARFDVVKEMGLHQAHTVVGAAVPGILSQRRHALDLLTNILGGPGMNSALNVALREKRGLVYNIDASTSLLTDTGLMTIYMGCDRDDLARCRRLIGNILGDAAGKALSPRRLDAAKKQYLGQLTVARAGFENMALAAARAVLLRGHVTPAAEINESVTAVSAADILDIASLIVPEHCSVLSLV